MSSPIWIPALPATIAQPIFMVAGFIMQWIVCLIPLVLLYGTCFIGLMLIVDGNLYIAGRLLFVFLLCKFAIGWDRICGTQRRRAQGVRRCCYDDDSGGGDAHYDGNTSAR
ncbi:hypothetical protein F5X96DRAFT_667647 [Biscogniauxia mediterranea]|nr:hypothetical protein F5X96DRAFT_667647 [Biscogniauxia mediterranea]